MNQTQPAKPQIKFPRYEVLPDIGLYMDQVLGFVNDVISDVTTEPITRAMVNNWIKLKALPSPDKKKYSRDHLCYIFVLASLKQVFSVQQIGSFFEIQRSTYPIDIAYNYFCTEYENAINEAFEFTGKALPSVETERTEQTILIRSMVLAATNRVYIEKCLSLMADAKPEDDE